VTEMAGFKSGHDVVGVPQLSPEMTM